VTPLVAGGLWAVLILAMASRRHHVGRIAALRSAHAPRRSSASFTAVVGRAVLKVSRLPSTVEPARVGRTALAFVIPLPVVRWPLVVIVSPAAALLFWHLTAYEERRARRRRLRRFQDELPDVVDLLVLAVGAGLTVPLALDAVARRGSGTLAAELGNVVAASRRGHRIADALEALLDRIGEPVRPLVAALVSSERYGAPLGAGLERLADEVRAARRRRADEAARKVPVKLLFPLVVCILPAFALLTVAPLIASALRSLRL
jgi:pilus assembly protein TadC